MNQAQQVELSNAVMRLVQGQESGAGRRENSLEAARGGQSDVMGAWSGGNSVRAFGNAILQQMHAPSWMRADRQNLRTSGVQAARSRVDLRGPRQGGRRTGDRHRVSAIKSCLCIRLSQTAFA
jgi:hypothetical protein